jgi:chromosome segregation ATPase
VLSLAEGRMIREHVEHEMREADTARAKASDLAETYKAERRRGDALAEERNEAWADLKRAHKASSDLAEKIREQREFLARVRGELDEAQAATERVRAVADRWTRNGTADLQRYAEIIFTALNGTDQTTT